ncbi:MAG: FAD binding domain-containing protein [Acidobacteriia bacterium]|nr:FAD binding domain-containing protein [Terriglobia bacterium]
MISFEYASPSTVNQALSLLGSKWGPTEILAGGTDLLALIKDDAVSPGRLVNIKKISGIGDVTYTAQQGLRVGALVTLDALAKHPLVTKNYPTLALAINDAASPQIRNRATLGGNLCQRPRCWYFRNGYGLLALDSKGQSLVLKGDNRYHAILGNGGPAYFVSPSTVAPTLIAFGATVVLQGPKGTRLVPLGSFYVTPQKPTDREHDLGPNEIVVEVRVPPPAGLISAYYEVRQKHGFDWPIATATVVMNLANNKVANPVVMMSHVAPVPWRSAEAEAVLTGQTVTPAIATAAAQASVKAAKSLGQNGYKIAVARVAVQRCILQAAGLNPIPEGGGNS